MYSVIYNSTLQKYWRHKLRQKTCLYVEAVKRASEGRSAHRPPLKRNILSCPIDHLEIYHTQAGNSQVQCRSSRSKSERSISCANGSLSS